VAISFGKKTNSGDTLWLGRKLQAWHKVMAKAENSDNGRLLSSNGSLLSSM